MVTRNLFYSRIVSMAYGGVLPRLAYFLLLISLTESKLQAQEDNFQIKNFDIIEGRIAFTYAVNKNNRDIYVFDLKELNVKPVVTTPYIEEAPSWSPDGKKIAFHSKASGISEIYVVNADGTDLTQLTNSKGNDEYPHWSPDGKKIVFQSSRAGRGVDIYVMNADGTTQENVISNGKRNTFPRWSPRGTELLFVSDVEWPGWDIVLYTFSSKQIKIMTQGLGSYIRPTWNPDGGSFAFAYGVADDMDIWKAEKGKSMPAAIVQREGRDLDPCWDDTGNILFFVEENTLGQEDYQLFMYNPNPKKISTGETANKVTPLLFSKAAIRHPSWTPFPSIISLISEEKNKLKMEKLAPELSKPSNERKKANTRQNKQ